MGREGPVVQVKSTQGQGAAPVRSAATKRAATCPRPLPRSGTTGGRSGLVGGPVAGRSGLVSIAEVRQRSGEEFQVFCLIPSKSTMTNRRVGARVCEVQVRTGTVLIRWLSQTAGRSVR